MIPQTAASDFPARSRRQEVRSSLLRRARNFVDHSIKRTRRSEVSQLEQQAIPPDDLLHRLAG